jgi:uncharacterized damage-inducible protein DinB
VSLNDLLLSELDEEIAASRAVLERVPEDKLDWRPHERSMPLGRLATHLAELLMWATKAIELDELDIAPPGAPPKTPTVADSVPEILALLEEQASAIRAALPTISEEDLMKPWTLKAGGRIIMTQSKYEIVRRFVINHMVHHRGQLTVCLRLNGIPVPSTYGPSADENPFG